MAARPSTSSSCSIRLTSATTDFRPSIKVNFYESQGIASSGFCFVAAAVLWIVVEIILDFEVIEKKSIFVV